MKYITKLQIICLIAFIVGAVVALFVAQWLLQIYHPEWIPPLTNITAGE